LGGAIAFEIAQQLLARGQDVATLILAEVGLEARWPLGKLGKLIRFVYFCKRVLTIWSELQKRNPGRSMFYYVYALCSTVATRFKAILMRGVDAALGSLNSVLGRPIDSSYEPLHYPGKLIMILAKNSYSGTLFRFKFARRLVAKLGEGGVEIYLLPGDHHQLGHEEPYVVGFAEQINACLDGAIRSEQQDRPPHHAVVN
jgi:hypothetical protein